MQKREVTEPSMEIQGAVEYIRQNVSDVEPHIGIVLGSGLGALVDAIEVDGSISYTEIPNFPQSTGSMRVSRACNSRRARARQHR